jgi:hypothetical protein
MTVKYFAMMTMTTTMMGTTNHHLLLVWHYRPIVHCLLIHRFLSSFLFIFGRTLWVGNWPLRTQTTQNMKRTQKYINVLSGIQAHNPSV